MINLIDRQPGAAPFSLLLALLLIVSISSCSRPDLADIAREHIAAVNTDDVEKNLALFTDDAVFEPDAATKLSPRFVLPVNGPPLR